jgi:hypothetical protein
MEWSLRSVPIQRTPTSCASSMSPSSTRGAPSDRGLRSARVFTIASILCFLLTDAVRCEIDRTALTRNSKHSSQRSPKVPCLSSSALSRRVDVGAVPGRNDRVSSHKQQAYVRVMIRVVTGSGGAVVGLGVSFERLSPVHPGDPQFHAGRTSSRGTLIFRRVSAGQLRLQVDESMWRVQDIYVNSRRHAGADVSIEGPTVVVDVLVDVR